MKNPRYRIQKDGFGKFQCQRNLNYHFDPEPAWYDIGRAYNRQILAEIYLESCIEEQKLREIPPVTVKIYE